MTYARGCGGSRVKGGIYLVTGLSEKGKPLEEYLLDPPVVIPAGLDVPTQGMGWFDREEDCPTCRGRGADMGNPCPQCDGSGKIMVTHVTDHIGSSHYPNVVDDIEEVRAIGSSRRIPSTFPFHKLTPQSRHFRCHSRGYIENYLEYFDCHCPKGLNKHNIDLIEYANEMCSGLYWEDYEPEIKSSDLEITKTLPCGKSFRVRTRLKRITPIYRRAFYMALPISGIEVVGSGPNNEGASSAGYERAIASKLNVTEVDE